jgi:TPR repeat protein/predicted DNA-binding WGR domain protein
VPLRQTYLSGETPCLEYEFIEGGDLAGAIYAYQEKKGQLPAEMATRIVLHLARSVGQLHQLSPPIVHRDLKPANVLVRKGQGRTDFLITDFGIGGVVASQALEQTRSGGTSQSMMTSLAGAHTPLYASPEQKRGEPPDPRDDVHALGIIWYQLLLGDFSVGAPTGGAWRRVLTQRGLSDALLHLLESCFETEAEHRPPNGAAVADRIEAILTEKPTTPPVSEFEQDRKEALEESRRTGSDCAYFERQGSNRIGAWRTAAQQGDATAQWLLARCLQEGAGIQKYPQVAVQWLRRAAESGLADAQNDLGICYDQGDGVEENSAKAFHWFSRAAKQGFAWAQRNLGACYAEGSGVTRDLDEAMRLFRAAAEQGLAEAMLDLGECYDSENGIEQNPAEAVRWYRMAAEMGHPDGQDALGDCYFEGHGVEEDYPQAINWWRKAAEQGVPSAQVSLASCYERGKGVKKNQVEAVKWYRKAADQGHEEAQFGLGYCYHHGKGVEQDAAQAEQWYRKAADQGHRKAKNALERLLKAKDPPSGDNGRDPPVNPPGTRYPLFNQPVTSVIRTMGKEGFTLKEVRQALDNLGLAAVADDTIRIQVGRGRNGDSLRDQADYRLAELTPEQLQQLKDAAGKKGYIEKTSGSAPTEPTPAARAAAAVPAPAGLRKFEFRDQSTRKFWNIELQGKSCIVTFGQIGSSGEREVKEFDDEAKAKREYQAHINEQVMKGWMETT